MSMHKPYSEILGHKADFRVKYRFYSTNEGGRKIIPYQGIRCDFMYADPRKGAFMIWPEFEDETGKVILDNTVSVPAVGTARMWVINSERRDYHCEQIKI